MTTPYIDVSPISIVFFSTSDYRYNLKCKCIPLRRNYNHSEKCCLSRFQPVVFYEARTFRTNDGVWFTLL